MQPPVRQLFHYPSLADSNHKVDFLSFNLSMGSLPQVKGYTIVERIGSGSYATVFKAFKKNGPREVVAIKCVDKSKLTGSAVENIITEISLLKVLKHQNIVEMKDFQWDERCIYIIMEYCGQGDLSNFIHKRRKLSEAICKVFLQQLALALKYLRLHNVCHMDLKPQNLLLTSTPSLTLKLGDFGFAQYLSTQDEKNSMRGSPLYMAPEILFKQKYDARVDLWSVGIIMFECLYGKAPYSSSSFQELATKIRSKAPIEVPAGSSISDACRDLLTKLLKHNPDERIGFEEFFSHPYLDLEHAPSPESYQKAVELVTDAIKNDVNKNYVDAFSLYCEALLYFIPIINAEDDPKKKIALRTRVNEYVKRAEDLKLLSFTNDSKTDVQDQVNQPTSSTTNSNKTTFEELRKMCSMTPALKTALEIGVSAEQYAAESKYSFALENFQTSLGILVPLLGTEPPGHRRDLLHSQTQHWMKQAESTKALLSIMNLDDTTRRSELLDKCGIQ